MTITQALVTAIESINPSNFASPLTLLNMLHNHNKPIHAEELNEEDEYEDFEYTYHEPGSPPGTLVIDEDSTIPNIFLIDYNADSAVGIQLATPEECVPYLDSQSVSWVDVQGLGSEAVLQRLGTVFSLHPLVLEDVVNVPQRPKVEEYADQQLIIAQMVSLKPDGKGFVNEQVSFVLGKNYLLTVQEEPESDTFEPVRQRIHNNRGNIRQQGADYLLYALFDTVIDGFFPVLEDYGERLEELEDEVVEHPSQATLDKIHKIKRELLLLRRAIWPQRDAINALIRDGSNLISPPIYIYLRDCYDHAVQIIDMVETYRELASNLMDVYLSSISNRMNEVMKVLTVISTIFIPLTFIVGVYGMNFDTAVVGNMPELKIPYGYTYCWVGMLAIALSLLFYFWRRGWLFSSNLK
ncbi:magnesium Mg(2+) and cobalt Co(2+) transport protein CorA [Synechococcus sp. PCC 7502]|uniref:magnesium/cobalt transporter CorA n=1 Tax=Synechococcus sp. PCC 7502 TaxID=1173263 RepID=UPI00029FB1CF|nr:magnesium/cobalt transporter CorA [Synechococcus sp. PCC 7502]AFY73340.1 magnesium Mg(2+) and cobalt Co(2+) transport protein CorA [Synechococcus sp. PCC 7502]